LNLGVEFFVGRTGEKYMAGFEVLLEEEIDKVVWVFEFSFSPDGFQTFCSGFKPIMSAGSDTLLEGEILRKCSQRFC